MSDLTDWLLACIAAEESAANAVENGPGEIQRTYYDRLGVSTSDGEFHRAYLTIDPARVLAVCKAHRAIVEGHTPKHGECRVCFDRDYCTAGDYVFEDWPCPTLRAIASIYADRPGWREEWAS